MGAEVNYLYLVPNWQNDISLSVISSSKDCEKAFREIWETKNLLKQERVYVIYLDLDRQPIRHELLNIGKLSETMFDQRTAVDYAFECNAKYLVIAHNHTSNDCNPSRADFEQTKDFKETLRRLDMGLLDHIIITPNKYYSFQDNGYLK